MLTLFSYYTQLLFKDAKMIKKILFGVLALMFVGVGVLFLLNGKDTYDASKFSADATDGLKSGSVISFTLPDQFDKSHSLTAKTKKVIFVFAKATGHTVKAFLKKKNKDFLPNQNALFVADISPMPTVIRNTFALPDFKKSSYSVLLIYDKAIAKKLKDAKNADKITVTEVENGVVGLVKHIETEEELAALLK
jgi:hypothetical protein